jgi:transposase-like protein
MKKVCKVFHCNKSTLNDWVHKYENNHKNLTRKNRPAISYKIKKDQVKTALDILDVEELFKPFSRVAIIKIYTGMKRPNLEKLNLKQYKVVRI